MSEKNQAVYKTVFVARVTGRKVRKGIISGSKSTWNYLKTVSNSAKAAWNDAKEGK